MIQDKIFFDEKDPTGVSYNTPFTVYGSYQGRLWSKTPSGTIKYYTQNSDLSVYATTGSNQFSGSQTVTGSLTVTGGITGSVTTASYVEYTGVANKPALVSGSAQVTYSGLTGVPAGIVSGSSQVTYSGLTGVPAGIVSSSAQIGGYGVFATTGSNQFNGSQAVTGSLTVTGQVIAQTLNVQQVTSSIVYSSGSNIFGNSLGNTQQFTGSVSVTGSLTVNGAGTFAGSVTSVGLSSTGTISLIPSAFTVGSSTAIDANSLTIQSANSNYLLRFKNAASVSLGGFYYDGTNFIADGPSWKFNNAAIFSSSVTAKGILTIGESLVENGIINSPEGIYINADSDASGGSNDIVFGKGRTSTSGGTTFMTIKNGGNVGIGTASPTDFGSTYKVLSIDGAGGGGVLDLMNTGVRTLTLAVDGGEPSISSRVSGNPIVFRTNNAGTVAERMRITSGGVVLINNTYASPYGVLNTFKTPVSSTYVDQIVVQSTGNYPSLRLGTYDQYDAVIATTGNDLRILAGLDVSTEDHNIRFYTSFVGGTGGAQAYERMRITSGGYLKASSNGVYNDATGIYHEIKQTGTSQNIIVFRNQGVDPYGIDVGYPSSSPNNTANYFFYGFDSTAQRFSVRSNGGISNYQANDVNLSDERTKKDIAPLESYWDKFKAIEIVKFKYKDQTHDDYNIGVIAQQVEAVAPEFVDVDGWDTKPKLDEEGNEIVSEEEPLKSIYTADLHHATIKVLQEAMAKIESLEALLQRNNIS